MAVNVIPTYDMEAVRGIVVEPFIWDRISDGVGSEDYYPTFSPNNQWLLIERNGENIGVIYVHCDTSCSIGFHPYLKKEHIKECRSMMQSFFNWFNSLPSSIIKVNAVIPCCFKSALNFAKKSGFQQEGISRSSFNHKGKTVDRVMLGITREEIEELLWAV